MIPNDAMHARFLSLLRGYMINKRIPKKGIVRIISEVNKNKNLLVLTSGEIEASDISYVKLSNGTVAFICVKGGEYMVINTNSDDLFPFFVDGSPNMLVPLFGLYSLFDNIISAYIRRDISSMLYDVLSFLDFTRIAMIKDSDIPVIEGIMTNNGMKFKSNSKIPLRIEELK